MKHNRCIVHQKKFRKTRRNLCSCVGDQLLRPLAERINLFGLVQDLQERILVRVILELPTQLFDRLTAIRVLLVDCRMRYYVVDVAAAGFSTTWRCALVVWGCSCFLIRLILSSTVRIRFQHTTRNLVRWHTCSIFPRWSSCTQYKSQALCCRERVVQVRHTRRLEHAIPRKSIENNPVSDRLLSFLWCGNGRICFYLIFCLWLLPDAPRTFRHTLFSICCSSARWRTSIVVCVPARSSWTNTSWAHHVDTC